MVFESKIRPVGSSAGIIVPGEVLEKEGLKIGQQVRFAVIKKDLKLIDELFGSAKGARPLFRDKRDRVFPSLK